MIVVEKHFALLQQQQVVLPESIFYMTDIKSVGAKICIKLKLFRLSLNSENYFKSLLSRNTDPDILGFLSKLDTMIGVRNSVYFAPCT